MSFMVSDADAGNQNTLFCAGPGRKVGALISVSYRTSQTGNKIIVLVYCIVHDKAKTSTNDDQGRILSIEVPMMESMKWKLGGVVKAHQVKGSIDLDSKSAVSEKFQTPIEIEVAFKTGSDGKQYAEGKSFYASSVDLDQYNDLINGTIEEYREFKGRKSGGSTSQSQSYDSPAPSQEEAPPPGDDDIPF